MNFTNNNKKGSKKINHIFMTNTMINAVTNMINTNVSVCVINSWIRTQFY